MPRSQNGWYASESLRTRVIEPVPGVKFRIVDNNNVATVFTYLVQQFHKRVDDVTRPHPADDWGFYYRANRNNPNSLSNHASGTAIDLDATEHPNGVPTYRTFTSRQIAEVHEILRELDGVVRWGGDYTRTADAMHFEINVRPGSLKLRSVARAIRGKGSRRRRKMLAQMRVAQCNVQIGKPGPDLADLKRFVAEEKPDVVALDEATNLYGRLDEVPGYKHYQLRPKKRRKNSISNTANVAILVKDGLPSEGFVYQMKRFWRGPKHNRLQDPRTYRWVRVKKLGVKWKIGAFHFPFGKAAQTESVSKVKWMFRKIVPGRPVIAIMDGNMSQRKAEARMADPVGAELDGVGVDYVIYKNCRMVGRDVHGRNKNHDHPWIVWAFKKK